MITGFMEVIIAVFEMQMRPCILRDLLCVWKCVCVCSDCLCVFVAYNDSPVFVSHPLLLFVFPQVMRETDTQVKWPSKLKIGAKSKKGDKVFVFQPKSVLCVSSPSCFSAPTAEFTQQCFQPEVWAATCVGYPRGLLVPMNVNCGMDSSYFYN